MIRFRFVHDHLGAFEAKRMCDLVEVPRSSFYAWLTRTPSARDIADAELLVTIRDIYQRSRGSYGTPRVYGQLRRRGHRVAVFRGIITRDDLHGDPRSIEPEHIDLALEIGTDILTDTSH